MIKTFDMKVIFADGSTRVHYNLSHVAVKRYRQHYVDGLFATHILLTSH